MIPAFGVPCHQLIGIAGLVRKGPIARNLSGTLALPLLGGFGCRIAGLADRVQWRQNLCPKNGTISDLASVCRFGAPVDAPEAGSQSGRIAGGSLRQMGGFDGTAA